MEKSGWYAIAAQITFYIVFFSSWIYCVYAYGYLWGLGLGWLPSYIAALIGAFLWPVAWAALAFVVYQIFGPV